MMQKHTLIIIALMLISQIAFSSNNKDTLNRKTPKPIPISEAIKKGILEYRVAGLANSRLYNEYNDMDGVHFGKCLSLEVRSLIDSFVVIELEPGQLLMPEQDSVQIMMITQKLEMPLYPKGYNATRIYAMCTQIHMYPPNIETSFRIGKMAEKKMIELANFFSKNHIQNMHAQHALWAYTDKVALEELSIYGADSISINRSADILNAVKIETAINKKQAHPESEPVQQITISTYWVYGGAGLFIVLSVVIVLLLLSKRNKEVIT